MTPRHYSVVPIDPYKLEGFRLLVSDGDTYRKLCDFDRTAEAVLMRDALALVERTCGPESADKVIAVLREGKQ